MQAARKRPARISPAESQRQNVQAGIRACKRTLVRPDRLPMRNRTVAL
jgi:hypothetical protein